MERRRCIEENKFHALMVVMRKLLLTGVSETAALGLIPPAWEFQSDICGYERKSNMTVLVPHANLTTRECVPRFTARLICKRFDVLSECLRIKTF